MILTHPKPHARNKEIHLHLCIVKTENIQTHVKFGESFN